MTAHSTPAELSASSVRMLGNAAMIAVLLDPTASIARHDDHRTEAKPLRWFNVAASSGQARADDTPHGAPALVLTVAVGCYPECAVQSYYNKERCCAVLAKKIAHGAAA